MASGRRSRMLAGMTASMKLSMESYPSAPSISVISDVWGPMWRGTKLSAAGGVASLVVGVMSGTYLSGQERGVRTQHGDGPTRVETRSIAYGPTTLATARPRGLLFLGHA